MHHLPLSAFRRFSVSAFSLILLVAALAGCDSTRGVSASSSDALNDHDVKLILDAGEAAAKNTTSLLRVDDGGKKQPTRMHIIVMNRNGNVVGRRSMSDAWHGSLSIATAKAYTAMAFSSDQNALTSRSIGALSQPGGPLWQIGNSNRGFGQPGLIEFPGGVPLYKGGKLVGGVGVSGDGVDQDEQVAAAAAMEFQPAKAIKIDAATGNAVPYVK